MAPSQMLLVSFTGEPLQIIPWQRAITLIVLGKATGAEPFVREVRSVKMVFKIPGTLKLNGHVRRTRQLSAPCNRENIFARDKYHCQYCGKEFPRRELTLDHILPRSRGGKRSWDNLITSCHKCNIRKGNKTPQEAGMKLLSKPHEPKWFPSLVKAKFNRISVEFGG